MNFETSLASTLAAADTCGPDLAHCPAVRVGDLEVVPAMRQLRAASGGAVTVQPLAIRVLLALADTPGVTCSRDDLVRAAWNGRFVGDDAIHRVISNLRRDLAHLSGGSVSIETIPKVGYRLRHDTERHGAGARGVAAPAPSRKFVNPWAAALVIASLVTAGLVAATRASADVTAIAVIADNAGADGETARFADGLTDDLARFASAMPALAFVEPGAAQAQEPLLLRVALDSDAERPTARVRLVDRTTGAVVWSREFAGDGGTLAELRELVANGVTGVVQCGLDRSAVFDDPVGLRLYLGACDALAMGDFSRARAFAQQITEVRPNALAGWACLANSTILAEAQNSVVDSAVLARAEGYARKALAVDAASGLAYLGLALASAWRGEPFLEILERGIEVDPDFALLHQHYALALSGAGMVSKAVDPALRAIALHPHDPYLYRLAVAALLASGRTDEAVALTEKMQRMWRYDRGVEMQRLEMLFYAPDAQVALATLSANPRRADRDTGVLYETLVWRADPKAYDWAQFDRAAEEIAAGQPSSAWKLSLAAARMGDQARALEWLGRAPPETFNGWSPMFAPEVAALRRDPRFFAKMASVGMVAKWKKSGRWPDFCADPGLTYDCRSSADEMAYRTKTESTINMRTKA